MENDIRKLDEFFEAKARKEELASIFVMPKERIAIKAANADNVRDKTRDITLS